LQVTTDGGNTWNVVDGNIPQPAQGNIVEFTMQTPADGKYQYRVIAVDAAGNQSQPSEISDVFDVKTRPGQPKLKE
jgi:hypothetical protein